MMDVPSTPSYFIVEAESRERRKEHGDSSSFSSRRGHRHTTRLDRHVRKSSLPQKRSSHHLHSLPHRSHHRHRAHARIGRQSCSSSPTPSVEEGVSEAASDAMSEEGAVSGAECVGVETETYSDFTTLSRRSSLHEGRGPRQVYVSVHHGSGPSQVQLQDMLDVWVENLGNILRQVIMYRSLYHAAASHYTLMHGLFVRLITLCAAASEITVLYDISAAESSITVKIIVAAGILLGGLFSAWSNNLNYKMRAQSSLDAYNAMDAMSQDVNIELSRPQLPDDIPHLDEKLHAFRTRFDEIVNEFEILPPHVVSAAGSGMSGHGQPSFSSYGRTPSPSSQHHQRRQQPCRRCTNRLCSCVSALCFCRCNMSWQVVDAA